MQIGGMAHFKIDGRSYSTTGEWDIKIQNTKREAVASADGSIHYIEKVQPDVISGKLLLTADLTPANITAITNSTIQVQTLKGGTQSVAVLKNSFFSGDVSVTPIDGTMSVEFTGIGTWM
jgi:hypothetical protein